MAALVGAWALCGGLSAQQTNLVVLMADDLADEVMTTLLSAGWLPNIQQYLVDGGVVFDNSFVTNSLCCPSRATLLRGQYSHNHGIRVNQYGCQIDSIGLPGWLPTETEPGRSESTIATWLQDQGYVTSLVGKYLNGYGITGPPSGPADPRQYVPPGWDDWFGLVGTSGFRMYDFEVNHNGTVLSFGTDPEDYQTDVLGDHAVQFINDRAADQQPFFLALLPFAPHLEVINPAALPPCNDEQPELLTIRPAPRHELFIDGDPANGEIPDPVHKPSFNEADVSDKPDCSTHPVYGPQCAGDRNLVDPDYIRDQFKAMAASMLAVDEMVGSLMQALIAGGLDGNTVVMFTSDNGWLYGEHRIGAKILPYEESIRVPLYVRSPRGAAGQRVDALVVNNDLAPTLVDFAGATVPYEPDGTSFRSLLADPAAPWGRDRFLVEHYYEPPGNWATFFAIRQKVSTTDFLFVETYADPGQPALITHREFYNLVNDPYQLDSVSLSESTNSTLNQFLSLFRQCEGQVCRLMEGF